nr:immunoglobulin heavy chain junction region [Macaca mulatta]MOY24003.1 immunoglobulin heavy chain junction region [Macaca mulatta]MOY25978.1 immunoglobulin heavy chain junction region [Macaca mulatta]MOY26609.1 immunoglobulin heavy chain junction region [Macaca mulatta]MOY27327.1 immunoglobulin heavy chain junction region [Macaca mulatta]
CVKDSAATATTTLIYGSIVW